MVDPSIIYDDMQGSYRVLKYEKNLVIFKSAKIRKKMFLDCWYGKRK